VALKLPEICPISDLARDARGLVARARERQEPIVITQRGRDVAVLLPIQLYREMQQHVTARMVSPRLVNPADATAFRMRIEPVEANASSDASI
jgi:prevent-host-death family protein